MFTIATLILLGLLAGIHFTVRKKLKDNKEKEKEQAEYLKQLKQRDDLLRAEYFRKKYSDSVKNKVKHTTVVDEVVMKTILARRKKLSRTKHSKRFV